MTRLQALAMLEHLQDTDPEQLPCTEEAQTSEATPLSLAAVASLSGWLDDLADDDLRGVIEAAEHGLSLVSAEIVSFAEWEDEILVISREVCRVMDARESQLN
jgi:hypothetical protein